jgi:pimeloyl-ACP methyl ester carboxylesterase
MDNFQRVTSEDIQICLDYKPKMINTAKGPVEYADRGEGPALLVTHGGPGGYDQGLGMGELFRKAGFWVLAVSRPGYLGTPLDSGRTLNEQADLLAAFLDAMELPKVAAVGASAGGPSSYLLAERHPDRVMALMEIDSISINYTKAQTLSKFEEALYLSKPGLMLAGFLMRHFPESMVKNFLKTESTLAGHELGEHVKHIVKDPDKFVFVDFLFKTMSTHYERRKPGLDNDLVQFEAIDKLPLSHIKCPTLIFQGDADNDVTNAHAEHAHKSIAGSELYWIKNGSHIAFWAADTAWEVQEHAVKWLKQHAGM